MLPITFSSIRIAAIVRSSSALLLGTFFLMLSLHTVEARIGERRDQLERRLLDDRTAMRYPQEMHPRKINHREFFYRNWLDLLPAETQQQFYFKRADGSKVSQGDFRDDLFPEGWDLHVIYYRDRVVFECYRRNGGEGLTEFEVNAILALNKGDSYWQEAKEQPQQPSVMRYQWILADGSARAARRGRMLVIINSNLDMQLKEEMDRMDATRKDRQAAEAPDSVAGF